MTPLNLGHRRGQLNWPDRATVLRSRPNDADEAPARFARARGRVRSWDEIRAKLEEAEAPATQEELVNKALTLTLIVELLFAVARLFRWRPNHPFGVDSDADEEVLYLTPRYVPIGRRCPKRLLCARWQIELSPRLPMTPGGGGVDPNTGGSLGERSARDSDWKFDRVINRQGLPPLYRFTGASRADVTDELYLVPEDAVGRDAQLRRRLKALGALRITPNCLGC